jgi:hypothetical protein
MALTDHSPITNLHADAHAKIIVKDKVISNCTNISYTFFAKKDSA